MSTVLDSRQYATAIKAALDLQLAPESRSWEYGEVPGDSSNPIESERIKPLPRIFVLVSLERRNNPNLRASAQAGTTGWRISLRAVGTSVNEARWAMYRIAVALNEQRLTIAGTPSTPIQFESDSAPESDDGRFSGTAFYTFAH